MKRFAIGLIFVILILGITAVLVELGNAHLRDRYTSSSLAAMGGSGNSVLIASLPSSQSAELSPPPVEPVSSEPASSEIASSEPESQSISSSQPEEQEPGEPDLEEPVPVPGSEVDEWRLRLVNQTHLLPEGYTFEQATVEGGYTFDARAAQALIQMLADGRAAGYPLRVVSTFRTVERSEYLYTNKIAEYQSIGYSAEDAAIEAGRWIAPPRTSEHNAGLAIDVVSTDYDQVYGDLMHEFENFPAFEWLSQNCAEYGFILRYPKDKQEITGITYEPWHYRYVGVDHARRIQELGMCLEEYVEWLEQQAAS